MTLPNATTCLDAIPMAALVLSRDGVVMAANGSCREMLCSHADVSGMSVSALLPDEATPMAVLQKAARSREPVRVHARRLNDVPVSADVFVSSLEGGATLLCLFREVRDTQLLNESQRWLDVAFETAPIGMALFNTDGCYVRVNAALSAMLQRPVDELLGTRDQEFTHPEDRQADVDAAWRILNGEIDTVQIEKRFLAPDGSVVWVIANMTFLRDEHGRPLCWLGQFQDITARKELEQQLRFLADHDELTGAANRRRLLRELNTHLQAGIGGAVILIDLDGFKLINDSQGHQAGDRVLAAVAAALESRLAPNELLGRLGGDEFAVILPEADAIRAAAVASALADAVFQSAHGSLRASCGIAVFGGRDTDTAEHVIATADRAMYAVKTARRARQRERVSADTLAH